MKHSAIVQDGQVNLLGMEVGGVCLGYSNAHYGHPRNMLLPTVCPNIGNGWETARRLDRPSIITGKFSTLTFP
jgi:allantoicase